MQAKDLVFLFEENLQTKNEILHPRFAWVQNDINQEICFLNNESIDDASDKLINFVSEKINDKRRQGTNTTHKR